MLRKMLMGAFALPMLITAAQADIFPGSSRYYLTRGDLAGLSCFELWVARNEIYARNGYCFRKRRARNYFGNAGCWTRNPRLNRFEQRNVMLIRRLERWRGCR